MGDVQKMKDQPGITKVHGKIQDIEIDELTDNPTLGALVEIVGKRENISVINSEKNMRVQRDELEKTNPQAWHAYFENQPCCRKTKLPEASTAHQSTAQHREYINIYIFC